MILNNNSPLSIAAMMLLIMACFCVLFLSSGAFVNPQITPKWIGVMLCAGVAGFVVVFSLLKTKRALRIEFKQVAAVLAVSGAAVAVHGILQYVGVFASGDAHFPVTGSFDNPAGFAAAIACTFPLCFLFFTDKTLYLRYTSIFAAMLMVSAMILSGSRAGILACAVAVVAWLLAKSSIKNLKAKIPIAFLLVALLVAFYLLKKDSADGRILIWRCTLDMIADKPILGHGQGAFRAKYMLYQADYFAAHPDSPYADLADNTLHPFNEFLLVAAEHGLVGVGLIALLIFLLVRAYLRHRSAGKQVALFGLLSLATISCFSYPFRYPFIWMAAAIGFVYLTAPIFRKISAKWSGVMGRFAQKSLALLKSIAFLLLSAALLAHAVTQAHAEMKWNSIARRSLAGATKEVLPKYDQLYRWLGSNGLFLYNHAAELNAACEYEKSIAAFEQCTRYFNDMDVQMLLADNYKKLGKYSDAERHLKTAAAMCPVRFAPPYELAKLYDATERRDEALAAARQILKKKAKVPSPTVNAIKTEMRQLIEAREHANAPDTESRTREESENNETRQGETPNGAALPP